MELAGAFLPVSGSPCRMAMAGYNKRELDAEGIWILHWALLGQLVILTTAVFPT